MLIFEITNTNTPRPQKGLAPILIAPPHTYIAYATQATISSVKQSKTNVSTQNTTEVIIISDTVNKQKTEKLLPHSIYDVLTQISNDFQRSLYRVQADISCCGASGVDSVLLTYREETKQPRRPIADLPLLELSPALES